jgi:two-component system chemotaxis response regulator CheB
MLSTNPIRVLVVDDTVVYRKIISDVLAQIEGVEIVGTAHNGKAAMVKIASLKPDLLTLDIEMPEMSGLEVLEQLPSKAPNVGAVMLSTLTQEGGRLTMKALELGAFDFIPKPQSGSMVENRETIKNALEPIIKAFARGKSIRSILRGQQPQKQPLTRKIKPVRRTAGSTARGSSSEIVAIGISTGGPNALAQMLPKLPTKTGVPIVIVQHMPPVFTQSLANSLNAKCNIEVREAKNGEMVLPDTAYIAPGGKQMKLEAGADGKNRVIRITDDPPENSCRPSADYLFRSVAHHYVGRATGVIMTGMGSDGSRGLHQIKRSGGTIIAQDEASCVVYGMPREPIESGIADVVAPLSLIASEIMKTIGRKG